jgi:hypothetical protein
LFAPNADKASLPVLACFEIDIEAELVDIELLGQSKIVDR